MQQQVQSGATTLFGLRPNSAILANIAANITASTAGAVPTRVSCKASKNPGGAS